jgi:uncharacterized membrane protein HdeD (DUF308 family)
MQIKKFFNHRNAILISGIIFVGAGIFPLIFEKATLIILTMLFSLALLLSGIVEIVFTMSNRKTMPKWRWSLTSGIISSIFGVLLLVNPFESIVILALCIGFAVLFRSVGGIVLSINLKKIRYPRWGYLLALSILGVLISFALILDPLYTWVSIIRLTAVTLIAAGIFSIGFTIVLKTMKIFYVEDVENELDVPVLQIS